MKDIIEFRIIELQRELKQLEAVIGNENATPGEHRTAHVEKLAVLRAINELYQLLIKAV